MIRTRRTVRSKRSPVKPHATALVNGFAARNPIAVRQATRQIKNDATPPASRPAWSGSSSEIRLYSGTKAADSAPSPKRFWRILGIRCAAANASPTSPIPRTLVIRTERMRPENLERLMPLAAAPTLETLTIL